MEYVKRVITFNLFILSFLFAIASETRGTDVETAGNISTNVLLASPLVLVLALKDGEGALQYVESETLTLGVYEALKHSFPSTRPNGGEYSFPSGHSAFSFTSAAFIGKRYGWEYGLPAYMVASFVAYSRVEARQHYLGDVVSGAAIGIVSSNLLTT